MACVLHYMASYLHFGSVLIGVPSNISCCSRHLAPLCAPCLCVVEHWISHPNFFIQIQQGIWLKSLSIWWYKQSITHFHVYVSLVVHQLHLDCHLGRLVPSFAQAWPKIAVFLRWCHQKDGFCFGWIRKVRRWCSLASGSHTHKGTKYIFAEGMWLPGFPKGMPLWKLLLVFEQEWGRGPFQHIRQRVYWGRVTWTTLGPQCIGGFQNAVLWVSIHAGFWGRVAQCHIIQLAVIIEHGALHFRHGLMQTRNCFISNCVGESEGSLMLHSLSWAIV